ncbi:MAG: response regulator [Pirellulales bacterium]|nr:response regulator [Pirellulales bacterium]
MQASATILHADHDPLLTRIVGKCLEKAGFHCRALHQADELPNELANGHYDILLLDLDIPGENGLEVLAKVRKIDPYLSVIILTSQVSLNTVMEARYLGAEYCFFKPIMDFAPLIAALRDAIQQREHWRNLSQSLLHTERQNARANSTLNHAGPGASANSAAVARSADPHRDNLDDLLLPETSGEMALRDAEVFCEFLEELGAVSAVDLQNAMSLLKAQTPKIGHLALQSRVLTISQVLEILQRQAQTNELFGQAALAGGYMTEQDLEMLLELQAESVPSLSETLVALGLSTEEEMQNYLKDFHLLRIRGKTPAVHEHPR